MHIKNGTSNYADAALNSNSIKKIAMLTRKKAHFMLIQIVKEIIISYKNIEPLKKLDIIKNKFDMNNIFLILKFLKKQLIDLLEEW